MGNHAVPDEGGLVPYRVFLAIAVDERHLPLIEQDGLAAAADDLFRARVSANLFRAENFAEATEFLSSTRRKDFPDVRAADGLPVRAAFGAGRPRCRP